MSEQFRQTWANFAKDIHQIAQTAELETKLNNTTAAENARKARQRQANEALKTGDILYTKDARRMVRARLKLDEKREQKREVAWEKQYKLVLQKCYNRPKSGDRRKLIKETVVTNAGYL